MSGRLKVVSIMEAQSVTGPAKNLFEFAQRARQAPGPDWPAVDLSVITYHRGSTPPESNPFIATAEKLGIGVDVIQEKGPFDRSAASQLEAALARRAPDLVQTHNVKSHFLMRYTGLWKRYRWLPFHHGYSVPVPRMRVYNQLDRWSLRVPKHVVTVCGPFRDQLAARGVPPERVTVQHNAIRLWTPPAPGEVDAIRRELNLRAGVPVLTMIGRLSREKGHLDFLAAAGLLRQRGVRFHAVFVGEGPERGRIEAMMRREGLAPIVTLAGHRNEIRPFLSLAELFLMPSHSEGSPNALLEAMAAGLPAVASRVGGIPEIATHDENAWLIPPHDPAALAEAIEALLADPGRARSLAGRAREVTARFTYEEYHRGLLRVYERVLKESA